MHLTQIMKMKITKISLLWLSNLIDDELFNSIWKIPPANKCRKCSHDNAYQKYLVETPKLFSFKQGIEKVWLGMMDIKGLLSVALGFPSVLIKEY